MAWICSATSPGFRPPYTGRAEAGADAHRRPKPNTHGAERVTHRCHEWTWWQRRDEVNGTVRSLQGQGRSIKGIIRTTGVSRQTVRRILAGTRDDLVQNRDLEATNNGSERALRPCAVYCKITNGFRQERSAHLYADIRSVIETARRRSVCAIDAIRLTLRGGLICTPWVVTTQRTL